jgi:hypothetical protein
MGDVIFYIPKPVSLRIQYKWMECTDWKKNANCELIGHIGYNFQDTSLLTGMKMGD